LPATPRNSRGNSTRALRWLVLGLAALAAAACADNRSMIDRTLDQRAVALNNKDLKLYLTLLAPDYVKASPTYDPGVEMQKLFDQLASIHYQAFSRNVQFEGDGRARITQDYRMVLTTSLGGVKTISGVDHFMMKAYGVWPFKKWLIHQGLDSRPEPPAASPPAAASPPGGTS